MSRKATKSCGNMWYEARKDAESWDSRMKSREGAAAVLGMSESAIADAELGYTKIMPPEKAETMAIGYKAPQLIGYFCKSECPLGNYVDVSSDTPDVSDAVIKLALFHGT